MNSFDDLTPWQQMEFKVRLLCETLGWSDAKIRHTFLGDGTPFDSGFIDWRRYKEELEEAKAKRKTRKKKGASVNESNKNK